MYHILNTYFYQIPPTVRVNHSGENILLLGEKLYTYAMLHTLDSRI